jgi:F0F1-type ATP synthase gamma subunit
MYNKQTLAREIASTAILKDLINAYEEIAANNMRKVRSAVVKKRDFLSELTTIYNEVRSTYKKELLRLLKRKKISDTSLSSLLHRNGKVVYIFLSTNASLYGNIVRDTYQLLRQYLDSNPADIIIIGKVGQSLFLQDYPNKEYVFVDFPDGRIDSELLKKILLQILPYEKVIVFHSKFDTIVSQKPVAFTLSGDESTEEYVGEKIRYLFEPALDTIIAFFEKEIFASLFEQLIHESDLSKFASRMTLLDKTLENLRQDGKRLAHQERILRHQSFNKSQQNMLSSISLWKGR